MGDTDTTRRSRAVVIGAGLAGLTSARVLADHFDEVLVLERDQLPAQPDHRRYVPQSHHAHGLLDSGRQVLLELFPDIGADLAAAGATVPDGADRALADKVMLLVRDEQTISFPAWWIGGYAASRALIEHTVRARLQRDVPRVELREGVSVVGLSFDTAARRVRGVQIDEGSAEIGRHGGSEIRADLVVDASGRASQLPRWLDLAGFPAPTKEIVTADVHYASVVLEPEAGFDPTWMYVLGGSRAGERMVGAALLRIEHGRYHLSLGALAGSAAGADATRSIFPTDWPAYRDFVLATGHPEVAAAVLHSRPVTAIRTYRIRANEFRRYDRIAHPVAGVLALGDAVCAFNPLYGQGMSVAVRSAAALGEELRRIDGPPGPGFERRVARRVAAIARPAWQLGLAEDLRFGATTEGMRGAGLLSRGAWYRTRMERAAVLDPEVALTFQEVLHLYRPPMALMSPRMLRRVLRPSRDRRGPTLMQLLDGPTEARRLDGKDLADAGSSLR